MFKKKRENKKKMPNNTNCQLKFKNQSIEGNIIN